MNIKNLLLIIVAAAAAWQCTDIDKNEYRTVGYVAGYRDFDFSKIEAHKLTHINYA